MYKNKKEGTITLAEKNTFIKYIKRINNRLKNNE